MLGIVAVGVVRSPENFQGTHVGPIGRVGAHCTVIFAIAQLSCNNSFTAILRWNCRKKL